MRGLGDEVTCVREISQVTRFALPICLDKLIGIPRYSHLTCILVHSTILILEPSEHNPRQPKFIRRRGDRAFPLCPKDPRMLTPDFEQPYTIVLRHGYTGSSSQYVLSYSAPARTTHIP